MPNFLGNYSVTGITDNNAWDTTDFDSTTDLSHIPDVTAIVQATVDAVSASGIGGVIGLPPGVFRINGLSINSGGIHLRGAGWEEFPSAFGSNIPAVRGKRGTYILTDNTNVSAINVNSSANLFNISDIAFIQPQTPEQPAWTPIVFKPSITVMGGATNGGAFIAERLLFWGCYQAMSLGQSGVVGTTVIGRVTLRDISYATFASFGVGGGIAIYNADNLVVDNVNFQSELLQGSVNQQSSMASGAYGLVVSSANKAQVSNCSFNGAFVGVGFYGTYASTTLPKLRVANANFSACEYGILESGTNVTMQVMGIAFSGLGSTLQSEVLHSQGTSPIIDIDMLRTTDHNVNAISVGSQTADVRFGPNLWINNWAIAGTASGGFAISATSGNAVYLSGTATRFTKSNSSGTTGGGGTFTTY